MLKLAMLRVAKINKLTERSKFHFLAVTLIVLGIFFRFVNLDRQVFWDDEAFTALRMSGYTAAELQQILYTSEDLSFPEIQKYLAPNLDKGIGDVIQGLALEDPHIPPFYILILRAWVQFLGEAGKELCGSSLGVMRSFSAIAGVLSLPAMYWLGLELFRSRLAASLGVALMAVSPFFVVYSQEARAYSFWGLITLASSALLLRTLRQPTKLRWLLYALSVSFGIYTHLFSILVTVGHGIYIFMVERYRFSKNFVSYLLATALGVATFTPWLVILISNARKTEEMVYNSDVKLEKAPFLSMISMWIGNISRIFFDVGVGSSDRLNDIILLVPIILPCFLLAICSIYFLCKNSSFRTWLFVIALIAVPAVFYVAVDVTQGIKVSGIPRYSVAIFIGIQLAVAFTFSTILTQKIYESDRLLSLSNSKNFIEQETHDKKNYRTTGVVGNYRFWKTLLVIVLSLGVISCMTRIPAKVWWNKGPENTRYVVEISSLIHRSHHPVVMTDDALNRVAAFGYELNPGVPIRLVRKGNLPKLPPDPREIFVFRPSEFLRRNIEQIGQGVLRPLPDTGDMLYKLDRTNSASRT